MAPIMNDEGKLNVYLPEGEWVDVWKGEKIDGPVWKMNMPLERVPVYVRAGAEIPIYPKAVLTTSEMDLAKAENIVIDDRFEGLGRNALGPLTGFDASYQSRYLKAVARIRCTNPECDHGDFRLFTAPMAYQKCLSKLD